MWMGWKMYLWHHFVGSRFNYIPLEMPLEVTVYLLISKNSHGAFGVMQGHRSSRKVHDPSLSVLSIRYIAGVWWGANMSKLKTKSCSTIRSSVKKIDWKIEIKILLESSKFFTHLPKVPISLIEKQVEEIRNNFFH